MKKIKISQVKANDSNPRYIKDHKFTKLVESIKEFPEMLKARPIVVNKEMVVLGGNMRLRACKEAGLKEVFIEQVDWSEEKQMQFIIKDNVSFGEWDWDVLANEWNNTEISDWGLDVWNWEDATKGLDLDEELSGDEKQIDVKHTISEDGYVRWEVILKEDDKKEVVSTLNRVKKDKGLELSQALIFVIKEYARK